MPPYFGKTLSSALALYCQSGEYLKFAQYSGNNKGGSNNFLLIIQANDGAFNNAPKFSGKNEEVSYIEGVFNNFLVIPERIRVYLTTLLIVLHE